MARAGVRGIVRVCFRAFIAVCTDSVLLNVFHHKTIKKKQYLKSLYDITNDELSYSILKKRLKRLHSSFHKNRNLLNFETKFQSLFEENGHEIENKINATYTNMKLKFPIKTFLKQIGDKISNKQPKL